MGSIRDQSLVNQYLRELAGVLGMDLDDVRREAARSRGGPAVDVEPPPDEYDYPAPDPAWPNPNDPGLRLERDTLKLMLQYPLTFDTAWNGVEADDFTHPGYAAVFRLLSSVDFGEGWTDRLRAAAPNDLVQQLLVALIVEPLMREPDETYSLAHSSRLRLVSVTRVIADVKSRLQRTDPVKDATDHRSLFSQLTELEMKRKKLQAVGLG